MRALCADVGCCFGHQQRPGVRRYIYIRLMGCLPQWLIQSVQWFDNFLAGSQTFYKPNIRQRSSWILTYCSTVLSPIPWSPGSVSSVKPVASCSIAFVSSWELLPLQIVFLLSSHRNMNYTASVMNTFAFYWATIANCSRLCACVWMHVCDNMYCNLIFFVFFKTLLQTKAGPSTQMYCTPFITIVSLSIMHKHLLNKLSCTHHTTLTTHTHTPVF